MSRVQINEKEVRMGNGILKIQNVDMGLLKDVSFEVETKTGTPPFHNGKLKPRGKISDLKFKATFGQINFDNLKKIFGGELTTAEADVSKGLKKRKILTFDDVIRKITTYPLEFFGTDEDGNKFGLRIFDAYAISHINWTFPDDYDMEATLELPVEFGAYPNENGKYFELIDEQTIEA